MRNAWTCRVLAMAIGAASLAGQGCWARLASSVVGGTLAASALALSGAMVGLAAGSLLSGRRFLRGTIVACAVSLAGLPWLLLQIGRIEGNESLRWALAALVLALGSVPFGAALPCLIGMRRELYALTTLGAVAGALGVSEFLAPRMGFDHIGFLLAGLILPFAALPLDSPSSKPAETGSPSRALLVVAFGLGVLGLGTEFLWLRILGFAWEASASTFALVTASYVAGLSLGAGIVQRWKPGRAGVGVGLGLSAATLAVSAAFASEAVRAVGPGERIAFAFLLVGGPAVFFGGTFACLLDGGRVGLLCGINSAGAAAGPLLFWAAAPWIAGPPQMLVFVACGYSGLVGVAGGRRLRASAGMLTVALGLGGALLAPSAPYGPDPLPFLRTSLGSTVAVTRDPRSGVDVLWIDRSIQGDTSALGRRIPRLLGRLSGELLGRPARRAMAIGLGTGITVAGIVDGGALEVEVAELSPGVIEAARTVLAEANDRVLERGGVRVFVEDGRTRLADADAPYDLIVTDMVFPSAVGAGSLFSREFYALARRRLTPDGVFVHWVPCSQLSPEDLASVFAAFRGAFPGGSAWIGFMGPQRLILGLAGGSVSGGPRDRLALGPADLEAWAAGAAPIRDADPRLEYRSRPRSDDSYGIDNVRALMARMAPSAWTVFAEAGLAELRGERTEARRLYREAARAGLADAEYSYRSLEFERHLESAREASERRDGDALLASLERAAACPLHGVGNLYLADALAAMGRLDEAHAQLRQAVAKSPRSADARFKLDLLMGRREK